MQDLQLIYIKIFKIHPVQRDPLFAGGGTADELLKRNLYANWTMDQDQASTIVSYGTCWTGKSCVISFKVSKKMISKRPWHIFVAPTYSQTACWLPFIFLLNLI